MKHTLYIYIIVLVGLLPVTEVIAQSVNNVADEVVWVVGDEAILKSDVEKQRVMGEKVQGNPYCIIPENIAIQKLFLHQAAIDSIEVTDAMVNQAVDSRLNEWVMMAGSKEKLEEYRNMSLSQLREEMFGQIKDMYTMSQMRKKLCEGIKVTPAEVRQYFKDLPEDSLPLIPTMVEVQIIVYEPVIPQEEIDRVKAELRDYTERITSGKTSFATLARLYSQDPGSARQGGEMDYAGRGVFDPGFANVAFSLTDPNKVSKIAKSEYGYHIIQLIDKRGDKIKVRHILRKPEVDPVKLDECMQSLDSLAENIRQNKVTFEEAALYSSDDKDTRLNRGVMFNMKVDEAAGDYIRTSRFEMKDLPVEVARAVEGLKTGEISNPFTMVNKKGKDVCAIVKLKSRLKQHRASITEDFQAMKAVVMAKKQEELIQKWIKEKQRATYVRINPEWRNCEFQYPGWQVQ